MAGLVDALIDRASEMFDEGTVDVTVDIADDKVLVDNDLSFFHVVMILFFSFMVFSALYRQSV